MRIKKIDTAVTCPKCKGTGKVVKRKKPLDKRGYVVDSNGRKRYQKVFKKHNPDWRPSKDMNIHHINGTKTDDRIENLILIPRHVHKWIHDNFGFFELLPNRDEIQIILDNQEYLESLSDSDRNAWLSDSLIH